MPFLSVIPASWQPYAKAVLPALLALVAFAVSAITTGDVDRAEFEVVLTGFLAAMVAFLVPNAPLGEGLKSYLKSVVPFVLTIIGVVLHGVLTGEFDHTELNLAITGVVSAIITWFVPNVPPTPPV